MRAGVLEQGSVDLLDGTGVGAGMRSEGLVHHGIQLRFGGGDHRIDFGALTGGRGITVYGQQEIVKDLIAIRLSAGHPILFEVSDVRLHDLKSERPSLSFLLDGASMTIECDIIAGCDGYHGVSRDSIPAGVLTAYARDYPFAWLGILAGVAPSSEELIYCYHERGFALLSMRSPTVSRLYLQVGADERIGDWSDARIWMELQTRLAAEGWTLADGPVVEKSISAMRSFVVEPMQFGRLFLAGDAAHIVPPTGAKGMNLALARREHPGTRGGLVLQQRRHAIARCVLDRLPAPRLARTTFLVVDDLDAAPFSGQRRVPGAVAAGAALLYGQLACGLDQPR